MTAFRQNYEINLYSEDYTAFTANAYVNPICGEVYYRINLDASTAEIPTNCELVNSNEIYFHPTIRENQGVYTVTIENCIEVGDGESY